jgi:acetyl-CoA carboxylase biotin carboxyl carrier protein
MDMRSIKKLIGLLDGSGVAEIEVREAAGRVRISRTSRVTAEAPHHSRHRRLAAAVKPPVTNARLTMHTELDPCERVITSPMVGTFYGSPVPGHKPFVRVGDEITRGQVLCIIDAMDLIHKVQSDRPGRVMWVMARNGDPVEFAQPLFVLQ